MTRALTLDELATVADRPAQEPLDPDDDRWAGSEWPDRSGQLERAPRRKKPAAG